MADHPPDGAGAEESVAGAPVEQVFHRRSQRHGIAAGVALHALGLAGRTGRIEDVAGFGRFQPLHRHARAAVALTQGGVVQVGQSLLFQRQFDVDDFLDLRQEPGVDVRDVVHFVQREALREGIAHVPDAFRTGLAQFDLQLFAVGRLLVQAVDTDFQTTQRLLERFLEGAADGHDFTHGLHLGGQARSIDGSNEAGVAPPVISFLSSSSV
ncbi:hypothetical protein G6F65_019806 [Rhizopus arrhizus]|nr:hypothetical protein G6F65_019806 [Rhizopus arrhizus]